MNPVNVGILNTLTYTWTDSWTEDKLYMYIIYNIVFMERAFYRQCLLSNLYVFHNEILFEFKYCFHKYCDREIDSKYT